MRLTRYKKNYARKLKFLKIAYTFFIFMPLISIIVGWTVTYHFIKPTLNKMEDLDKKLKKYELPVLSIYSIELGAFEDREIAKKQIVFLRNKGIFTYTLDEKPYKILGGIFIAKAQAQDILMFLKEKGVSGNIKEEKKIEKFLEIPIEYEKEGEKISEIFIKLNDSIKYQGDLLIKLYMGKVNRNYYNKEASLLIGNINVYLKEINDISSSTDFVFLSKIKSLFELQQLNLQKMGEDLNALMDGYIQVVLKYEELFEQLK